MQRAGVGRADIAQSWALGADARFGWTRVGRSATRVSSVTAAGWASVSRASWTVGPCAAAVGAVVGAALGGAEAVEVGRVLGVHSMGALRWFRREKLHPLLSKRGVREASHRRQLPSLNFLKL